MGTRRQERSGRNALPTGIPQDARRTHARAAEPGTHTGGVGRRNCSGSACAATSSERDTDYRPRMRLACQRSGAQRVLPQRVHRNPRTAADSAHHRHAPPPATTAQPSTPAPSCRTHAHHFSGAHGKRCNHPCVPGAPRHSGALLAGEARRRGGVCRPHQAKVGQQEWTLAEGVLSRERQAAVQSGDRFPVGEQFRTFLAVSVMKLVEEGRLGLDDPVTVYLPRRPHGK